MFYDQLGFLVNCHLEYHGDLLHGHIVHSQTKSPALTENNKAGHCRMRDSMESLKRLYMYLFKTTCPFPGIVVLSKYHTNKTSNWIIQYSRFDLKKQKNAVYLFIPFALFPFQNQIRKNKKRLCYLFFLILF